MGTASIPISQVAHSAARAPLEILDATRSGRIMIQDFCPLAESIDWELGQLYWLERGSQAFLSGEVPFTINNDGNLSAHAAEVFLQSLCAAEREGQLGSQIWVLELGIGVGLFARYFLDGFRDLCCKHHKDYYERLCYVAADRSERMLKDLAHHDLLASHSGHYQLRVIDALHPSFALENTPAEAPLAFRAIFLNYVLDSLPAAILKINGHEVSQLCLRTYLARGVNLQDYTELHANDLIQRVALADPVDKIALLDLHPLFTLDCAYHPVKADSLPYTEFILRFAQPHSQYVLYNYGAMQCLDSLGNWLHDTGFILMSDYGYIQAVQEAETHPYQHFASSTAIGLNFPLLKSYFAEFGQYCWVEPVEDHGHIYTRLLGRRLAPEIANQFRERFSKVTFDWMAQPIELARSYLKEGRYEAGLVTYREALARQPRNWVLLGEIANFLTLTLHDYMAGLEMVQAGLALNPISPDLWNTFGDSLFYLRRVDEAHKAFLRALKLNPSDVRARYNLVYTFSQYKDYTTALKMIAEGLIQDNTGEYRERFLTKQSELLTHMSQLQQKRTRYLANRFSNAS